MRRSLNSFTKTPYILDFRLTMAHKNRLYALSRDTGTSVDEALRVILDLGFACEKYANGRTDMVYYDPDMTCNDFYHAILVKGFAAYDAGKR